MAADGIECQGGRILGLRADLAVWNKPELHQGLEAIADAEHQAVAFVEHIHYSIGDARVAEYAGDELGAAFGLVAGAEAAGNHDDLAIVDGFHIGIHALTNLQAVLVAEYDNLALGTSTVESACAVVFAVGAGEGRNEDMRFRNLVLALVYACEARWVYGLDGAYGRCASRWEYTFKCFLPGGEYFFKVNLFAVAFEDGVGGNFANLLVAEGKSIDVGYLGDNPTVVFGDKVVGDGEPHTQFIAEGHLADSFNDAAEAERISAAHLSGLDGATQGGILVLGVLIVWHAIFLFLHVKQDEAASGLLQLGGDGVLQVADANSKGAKRRRHVNVVEGSAHGVFAADGWQLQTHLCIVGT